MASGSTKRKYNAGAAILSHFSTSKKHPAASYNQGTTFTKETINKLPIPEIASVDRAKLVSIVDRIPAVKQRKPETDSSALGGEIDRHIDALYGPTKKEIALVEGSQAK